MKENIILDKSYRFAIEMIVVSRKLKERKEFHFADQLLRSSTSIGANVREASAAQSKKDFISKMSIASKEARETAYWLNLINDSELINYDFDQRIKEIDEIVKILTAILKTAKSK